MPEIKPGENKKDFMARCINEVTSEGKEVNQAVAICNSIFDQGAPKVETALDKLIKIKKALEKNGFTVDLPELDELIQRMQIKPVALERTDDSVLVQHDLASVSPNGGEQRILIFPRGNHYIEKADTTLTFDDTFFSQVINSFNDENLSRPFIDKNHEYKESFGDILGLDVDDLGMYARIKLNATGEDLVRGELYTNISPSFGPMTDTTGKRHENALLAVSLTNIPALMGSLPRLQEQLELERSQSKQGGVNMELTRLYKVLELQNGASIDAIIESIQAAQAEGEDNAKIIAALEEQLAAMKTEKDEMAEANEEMKAQLAQVEAEKLEGEAETVVLEAIKKGQYEAAEKDLKIEQYKVNKDWVLKELEIRQPKNDAPVSLGARSDSNAVELSNEDRAIMLSLSMDPDNADERKAFLADINEGV
jgi:hypothetical protein